MSRQDDLKKLIAEHYRHLQILKQQEAGYGRLNVPTYILTQIQDREAEIENLQVELAAIEETEKESPQPKLAASPAILPVLTPMETPDPNILSPQHSFEPELILIPAGEFLMGSDPQKDKQAQENEQPRHRLSLPDYYIAKTPMTNAHYAAFIQATKRKAPYHWENGKIPDGKENHPVT